MFAFVAITVANIDLFLEKTCELDRLSVRLKDHTALGISRTEWRFNKSIISYSGN